MKKGFIFYNSWEREIHLMNDKELRNFILNLIRYNKGEEVILNTREEQLVWPGIQIWLDLDREKWIVRSESGKKGGAPRGNKNASKETT